MPRPSKITQRQVQPLPKEWTALWRVIEAEGARWSKVSKATRLTYEQAWAQYENQAWDMSTARKKTRYVMRAAGLFMMRKQLKMLMREAKKLHKDGVNGTEDAETRKKQSFRKVKEAKTVLERLRKFEALDWKTVDDPKAHFLQKDHKKKPATDADLKAFYKAAEKSQFGEAFLVMEFAGIRGQELEKGVRVELFRKNGAPALRFLIESAKSDGEKKRDSLSLC